MNEKILERSVIIESNRIDKRLVFIRSKLNKTQHGVETAIKIPRTTLGGWESGVRTLYYEHLKMLSLYYDEHWQKKFKTNNKPIFEKRIVQEISLEFILFGWKYQESKINELLKELQVEMRSIELRLNVVELNGEAIMDKY